VLPVGSSAAKSAELACLLFVSLVGWASGAQAGYYCANDPRIEAVDLSAPVDQSFLDTMRGIGIKTVIRYYDHEDETLPGKTLRAAERNLILTNGFQTAVVFQHHNNRFASFTALRGQQDAERSLLLAQENLQPKGSAIYFGVDGPWQAAYELANVAAYFRELKARLAGLSYRIGVYGSGLVCNMLLSTGLAELCWLGAPTSWPDYHAYYQTRKWGLAQLRTSQCGGRSVDFNLANDSVADYGQFVR
jgi:Rv2525c-like, glycoside hydrolase-like domain